jgi:hypothetical protein
MQDSVKKAIGRALVASIAAATPASLVSAASPTTSGPVPARASMKLANGNSIELIRQKDGTVQGRVLDAKGRVISTVPKGQLLLDTGKQLKFNERGQLIDGSVPSVSFLLMCDPGPKPPCP